MEVADLFQKHIANYFRWRSNRHFAEYAHLRHEISSDLVAAVPSYGAALLQVHRLCEELLQLNLLPLGQELVNTFTPCDFVSETSKMCKYLLTNILFYRYFFSKCYQLGQFENIVNYLSIQGEKVFARFFR